MIFPRPCFLQLIWLHLLSFLHEKLFVELENLIDKKVHLRRGLTIILDEFIISISHAKILQLILLNPLLKVNFHLFKPDMILLMILLALL